MFKSTTFEFVLQNFIINIKTAQREFSARGKKESLSWAVNKTVTRLIEYVKTKHLLESNKEGDTLVLVITAFSAPEYSTILKTILDDLLPTIQSLSTEIKASIYTAKADGLSFLKLVATSYPDLLEIILREICTWEDPAQILKTFTGMGDQRDINISPYSFASIQILQSKLALLSPEQRVKLLKARDELHHNWNALAYAYAPTRKDTELMKTLLQMPEVFQADSEFLSDPTDSSQVNANIFIYMLGQLNLVTQLQQLEDLPTLKKMLTARGDARKNALAIALEARVYSKALGGLLGLIQRLDIQDQTVVLKQLTTDEQTILDGILDNCLKVNKEKVASCQLTAAEQKMHAVNTACYQGTIELVRALLQQNSPTQTLFKAETGGKASAAAGCFEELKDTPDSDKSCLTDISSTPS